MKKRVLLLLLVVLPFCLAAQSCSPNDDPLADETERPLPTSDPDDGEEDDTDNDNTDNDNMLATGGLMIGGSAVFRYLKDQEPVEDPLPPAIEKVHQGTGTVVSCKTVCSRFILCLRSAIRLS